MSQTVCLREIVQTAVPTFERGAYEQLNVVWRSGKERLPNTGLDSPLHYANRTKQGRLLTVANRLLTELEAGNLDEHRAPAWETGAAFDGKGRGEAVNVDLYGLDDVDGQLLVVVQVRQFARRHQGWYASIRKNYFLCGRNEISGLPFAHPIPAMVVRAAIRKDPSPASAVTAARAWIFNVPPEKLPQVLRHGDVALVPVRALPKGDREVIAPAEMAVIDAHFLQAEKLVRIGQRLYAWRPLLQHLKGQHADVAGTDQWYRVQVGLRADTWDFAQPTAD